MIIINRLLPVLLLLYCLQGLAQTADKSALKAILENCESRFDITFTYIDDHISGIIITPPAADLSLNATLDYLSESSGLNFQVLNDQYVTISKPEQATIKACGILKDGETGTVISGATIAAGNQFAISNEQGYFEMALSVGDTSLAIRHLGYESQKISAGKLIEQPCKTIQLRQKTTRLKEVFITNYIARGIDKKIDGSIEVKTKDLGVLPGLTEPDVLHSIQALPGIQSTNETVSDINVRGGTNDQNLILWDGIRMYQSGHFFGLISAFNPYLTEKVTLIKNGTSAALGSGVSSTIDIQTDEQITDKLTAGAGMNLINGDIYTKIPLSNSASIQISGRRSIADMIRSPTYQQYFDRAFRDTDVINPSNASDTIVNSGKQFYFYDVSMKYRHNLSSNDKLSISFLNIFNDIEYQENELVDDLIESRTSGLEQQNLAAGITYDRSWNDKINTSAILTLSWYRLNAVNFDILNDQRLIQENEILDLGLKLQSGINLNRNFDLLSGYQLKEVGAGNLEDINNPRFRRFIKEVVRTHALFVEGDFISNSGNTNLRTGLRINYLDKFNEWIAEPRLVFNQQLLNNFYLEILGEMKSQSTTQIIDFQTDFLGIEKRRWMLANQDDIPIIKSKQVSAGLQYDKNDLMIDVSAYYKYVDGITASSQGFQNQFQYKKSIGSYTSKGFDLLIDKTFGRFSSWIGYSLANSTYRFDSLMPNTFPNNFDIRHTTTLGVSFQTGNIEISSGFNWHTGKPFTKPMRSPATEEGDILYQRPNSSRLDQYLRADLSARYTFSLGKSARVTTGLSFWNILNKKNIFNTYYQLGEDENIKAINQYALSFTPNLNIRVQF